jgi:outer membrane protein TolC
MQAVEQYQTRQTLAGNSNIWPQDAWWRSYGDAQLDALIDEGLKGSPTMTIAEARLRRAIATTQVARSASQPQVSAHTSFRVKPYRRDGKTTVWQRSISAGKSISGARTRLPSPLRSPYKRPAQPMSRRRS